ncbi:hypothetical protein QEH59_01315 [Coraliomargarita sp. SDUM461004]|uniref:Type 4a pilus biogenesis protein PilO n=1 Tax=Thalassobacterium sedimentorum TaxID=3041258 RepID=A0ABU1AGR9_9BACT|nr:hypothetical protein [Coraliomargarita sp. SDUM461004]MDQ8193045.1 hypothetical protein [Coraliomargarita sp. SDUM461004]
MKAENKTVRFLKQYPLAVLCVVVSLACCLAIILRGGAGEALIAQEADLNSRIRTIDQNVKNSKNLTNEVGEVQALVEQIESRLFNRDQRAVNINFFYSLEDQVDVRISNIGQMPAGDPIYTKGGPRELKLHSTIGYNISVNGAFDDILAFMYELHRVEPLIRVADFQVADSSRKGDSNILEARLRVIVLAEKD